MLKFIKSAFGIALTFLMASSLFAQTKETVQSGINCITVTTYPPRDLTDGKLPVSVLKEAWNTDQLVRWDLSAIFALLAEQSYSDDNETLNYLIRGMGFTKWIAIKNDTMAAHVVSGESVSVVIFRGTNPTELPDWYTNLSVNFIDSPYGRFHSGFTDAYKLVKKDLRRFIDEGRPEHLWVTGHSLGGAMAVACGVDLIINTELKPTLVTFGQPRYADSTGAKWLDQQFKGRYARFVRGDDIVPRVPFCMPRFFPYAHAGRLVAIFDDRITVADSEMSTTMLAAPNCDRCGVASIKTRIEVYQPTVEPPPLTEQEFRASLHIESALLANSSSQVTEVRLIPHYISDHLMTCYRELIRRYRDGQLSTSR